MLDEASRCVGPQYLVLAQLLRASFARKGNADHFDNATLISALGNTKDLGELVRWTGWFRIGELITGTATGLPIKEHLKAHGFGEGLKLEFHQFARALSLVNS
jgi:hypothetical protein